jgi:glutamine amidotransferase
MAEAASPLVAIVDYGMGNLYSVQRACEHVEVRAVVTSSPDIVLSAAGVVLPGVGAMPDAMETLDVTGLSAALRLVVQRGTPLFGVCLGLQLLMREGSEFRPHAGLGLIEGRVVRFEGHADNGRPLRVPHIGWNAVQRVGAVPAAWSGTPLASTADGTYMYFVHSYYVVPEDPGVVVATARYGDVEFCAALRRGNTFACQFHPERSGPAGLEVYRAFGALVAAHAARPERRAS